MIEGVSCRLYFSLSRTNRHRSHVTRGKRTTWNDRGRRSQCLHFSLSPINEGKRTVWNDTGGVSLPALLAVPYQWTQVSRDERKEDNLE